MLGEETNYTNRESWKHTVIHLRLYLISVLMHNSCATNRARSKLQK